MLLAVSAISVVLSFLLTLSETASGQSKHQAFFGTPCSNTNKTLITITSNEADCVGEYQNLVIFIPEVIQTLNKISCIHKYDDQSRIFFKSELKETKAEAST